MSQALAMKVKIKNKFPGAVTSKGPETLVSTSARTTTSTHVGRDGFTQAYAKKILRLQENVTKPFIS